MSNDVLVVTTNDVPGYEVVEVYGEVFGLIVRTRNVFSNIGAVSDCRRRRGGRLHEAAVAEQGRGDAAHARRGRGQGRQCRAGHALRLGRHRPDHERGRRLRDGLRIQKK